MTNCLIACNEIIDKFPNGIIRKVINKNDPWQLWFSVKHIKGNYNLHFVIQTGDNIFDPFLKEKELIPVGEYLERAYKNSEELKIV